MLICMTTRRQAPEISQTQRVWCLAKQNHVLKGDAALNGYVLTIPAVEYTDAVLDVGTLDQDVMVDLTFMAKIDPVTSKMVALDRFGA